MKLYELLKGLSDYEVIGTLDTEITALCYDSRKVVAGAAFVCIVGAKSDGHGYIEKAVGMGAAVIIAAERDRLPENLYIDEMAGKAELVSIEGEGELRRSIVLVLAKDTREVLACASAAWFGNPAEQLTTIGITGTKGKTTSAYMVKAILEGVGRRVGLIGTVEIITGKRIIPSANTTPESYTVQECFREMVDAGCDTVVCEVSSQGLMQKRVGGFCFDYGVFTNIEPDHISPDEHKSFEEYMECKGRLFRSCRVGIVNIDDKHTSQVLKGHTCSIETFGMSEAADLRAVDIGLFTEKGKLGIQYRVSGLMNFMPRLNIPGRFNVYNSLTAIAICRHFNVAEEEIIRALPEIRVKGRVEMVHVSEDYTLLIDYAHNSMALQSLLSTLREYNPKRLVCMFGCGGNRARDRRFEMGEVSSRMADLTVVTSDNPRDEEPQAIIEDILTGVRRADGEYITIADRMEAIRYVIENAQKGDIIVLAGKGHEDYQEIKGHKYHMDEREMIAEIVKNR